MSSATSTESSFRPWQFFVLAALVAATAAVVLTPAAGTAPRIVLSAAVMAAAAAALALHRTVWPLMVRQLPEGPETFGRRTRAALEREKVLVLRSIKELEFDRAMGKVSDADFHEMGGRLRARAVNLMKQLDEGGSRHSGAIERELEARLARIGSPDSPRRKSAPAPAAVTRLCPSCSTANDPDARFCKACGTAIGGTVGQGT